MGDLQVKRWALGGLLLLVLALMPWWARASIVMPNGTVAINYVTGGAQLVDGAGGVTYVGRTFADPSVAARTVGLAETYGLELGGRSLTVQAARTLTAAEVGAAAVAVGAAAWGGCAIGTAISDFAHGGVSGGARIHCNITDGWIQDPGQPQVHLTLTCWGVRSGDCYGNATGALNAYWKAGEPESGGTRVAGWCDRVDDSHYVCARPYQMDGETYLRYSSSLDVYLLGQKEGDACPGVIDPLDSRWNITEGSAPGPDGKCPSGRYAPISPTQAADQLGKYGNPEALGRVAEQTLAQGQPITTASPRSVSGPASATGTPTTTTTTNSDGTTSTTTSTPTVHYTYNGDTINYNTTYVTTTVNNTTGQTTTTTTENPQESDLCKAHPEALACQKLGELPTDAPQWQTKTVDFAPEDLGLGGSCPPPRHMSIRGWDLVLNYQPACDVAPVVRVGLLALTALGCLLFIIKTVRA